MKKVTGIFLLSGVILLSCGEKVSQTDTRNRFRNGIQLQAEGLQVEQAFLMKEDGRLFPADNKIEIKEKVKLRLVVSGWTYADSLVYPGASQKVTTSTGVLLSDAEDLFERDSLYTLTASEARYINLLVWIDEIDELYEHFLVEFHVWDKKGGGEIRGSYKLYLK